MRKRVIFKVWQVGIDARTKSSGSTSAMRIATILAMGKGANHVRPEKNPTITERPRSDDLLTPRPQAKWREERGRMQCYLPTMPD